MTILAATTLAVAVTAVAIYAYAGEIKDALKRKGARLPHATNEETKEEALVNGANASISALSKVSNASKARIRADASKKAAANRFRVLAAAVQTARGMVQRSDDDDDDPEAGINEDDAREIQVRHQCAKGGCTAFKPIDFFFLPLPRRSIWKAVAWVV